MIFHGEEHYDIFARWKRIGWDPYLNDGARLNIRPFMSVADVRKKDAGVLHKKPNIHWKKHRAARTSSLPSGITLVPNMVARKETASMTIT